MNNLDIYEKVRKVPDTAKKPIKGGRLKGFTDINPVWRIKTLTEQFGMVGIGWYYEIKDKRFEKGGNDEVTVFIDIDLFVKVDNEWSKPIVGTGGSMFVDKETKGLKTSDECVKMALTDALGVACKAIGIGADVYWEKDANKYQKNEADDTQGEQPRKVKPEDIIEIGKQKGYEGESLYKKIGVKKHDDIKFLKAERKVELYDKIAALPDKHD